jgi:hypothetical protein
MRLFVLSACVLGCASPPGSVVVDIAATGWPAPTAVVVSVFDGHGLRGQRRIDPAPLPGRITINGLSASDGMLRVIADGVSPHAIAGQAFRLSAGQSKSVSLMLEATTPDSDNDGVPDALDDCPTVPDSHQTNSIGYGAGDACRGGDLGTSRDLAESPKVNAPLDASAPVDAATTGDLAQGQAPGDLAMNSLAAPTGLHAVAGNTQVKLTWNIAANAVGYLIARATQPGGPFTTVASVVGTSFTDSGLTDGTTYYYVVATLGMAGSSSAPSSPVSAMPTAPIANGTYRLINYWSGDALDDDSGGGVGTALVQWGYHSSANQQWTLTAIGAYYTVVCLNNGLAASVNGDTTNGALILLEAESGSDDQLWTITAQPGGNYVFKNKMSGLALDDPGGSTSAGTQMVQSSVTNAGEQQWSILPP